jgi:hypothetical protein
MAVKKASVKTGAVQKKEVGVGKKVEKMELKQFLGEIQKKAYDNYMERQRNGSSGNDMSDWLKAEKDIKAKYKI